MNLLLCCVADGSKDWAGRFQGSTSKPIQQNEDKDHVSPSIKRGVDEQHTSLQGKRKDLTDCPPSCCGWVLQDLWFVSPYGIPRLSGPYTRRYLEILLHPPALLKKSIQSKSIPFQDPHGIASLPDFPRFKTILIPVASVASWRTWSGIEFFQFQPSSSHVQSIPMFQPSRSWS